MADSNVPITAGAGTNIDTYQLAGGDHQQYVREAPASAASAPSSWTLSTTASTSVLTADASRRWVALTNTSTGVTVYMRFDATAPTTAAGGYHMRIPPGTVYVLEKEVMTLAMSFIASAADAANPLAIGVATAA